MRNHEVIVAIDRVERAIAVAESDDGRRFEVPVARFKAAPREGRIYRVPVDERGELQWEKSVADDDEMQRRRKALGDRVDHLRKKDPGGDVTL